MPVTRIRNIGLPDASLKGVAFPRAAFELLLAASQRVEVDLASAIELETVKAERDILRDLINRVPDQLFIKDTSCRFVVANEAVVEDKRFQSGEPATTASIIGKSDFDLFPAHLATKFRDAELEIMRSGTTVTADMRDRRPGAGWSRWVSMTKVPLTNASGEVVGLLGVGRDVSARKQAEERLEHLAHHDPLTGLPNRELLARRLAEAIGKSIKDRDRVTVLFVDLDKFKLVNDGLGHGVGDALLQIVADRLQKCVTSEDTVARIGGDEFVVLLSDAPTGDELRALVDGIRSHIGETVVIQGRSFSVTASVGVAAYPDHGESAETLLRNADAAMYRAKQFGRDNHQLYAQSMNRGALEHINVVEALRHAIARQELRLEYQPLVELDTGRVIAAEALLRWTSAVLGPLSPAQFIPVAEETGLIVPIGEWVLEQACQQQKIWQSKGLSDMAVCVNVSARQFVDPAFIQSIEGALGRSGLSPAALELELTETMIMEDLANAQVKMAALNKMGVRLSIDDFGTGYSSLSALKRFPIQRLKIDKSFIQGARTDPNDGAIVTAVISLGQKLNLKVLAEGIETRDQLDFLVSNGCKEGQGYFFSRPKTPDQFLLWSMRTAGIRASGTVDAN